MLTPETNALIINVVLMALLVVQPLLCILALFRLRRLHYRALVAVLWVLVIVLIPLWGAIAFFLVARPEAADRS